MNKFIFCQSIVNMIPKFIKKATILKNEIVFWISSKDLTSVLHFLRDYTNSQAKLLIDITAVDYPNRKYRFEVVYHLLSVHLIGRLRLKICTDQLNPVPSIVPLYAAANWWEREVWDMFGIFFSNHPDLRRILTDYGFEGYPLRKDFPLTGYVEVRYDDSQKRVVSEPLEMTQEFRSFDFLSPWEKIEK
nr:NADH dehydrogenase subunit 9 [Microheliella maris]BDN85884.1 NADH dehydrogenase subunit 9 [Microheliella maris]